MGEYQDQDMPATALATEQFSVVMNAWQRMVADFDADIADGKATFGQKPTQQSVQEEYSIYVMGVLLAGSTVDTLGFWKVKISAISS